MENRHQELLKLSIATLHFAGYLCFSSDVGIDKHSLFIA